MFGVFGFRCLGLFGQLGLGMPSVQGFRGLRKGDAGGAPLGFRVQDLGQILSILF